MANGIDRLPKLGVVATTSDLAHELAEARSEIARHHGLIVQLRDGLAWALEYIDNAVVGLWADGDYDRWVELQLLLKRGVG